MSEIRATTISDLAGTGPATLTGQYAAKAWVNFNGTGTVAIRESANVSSITDNGTGDYTLNYTSALADANYAVVGSSALDNILSRGPRTVNTTGAYNTNSIRVNTVLSSGSEDQQFINVTVTR